MCKGNLKIYQNTVVHCPTKELANKVLAIAHSLGYRWSNDSFFIDRLFYNEYKEQTCYDIYEGKYGSLSYFQNNWYYIISAEEFINLHTMNKKVYYRGDSKRGNEIIEALEKLGGINDCLGGRDEQSLYYINRFNRIHAAVLSTDTAWLLQQAFTEVFLPREPRETIIIGGIEYDKQEVENRLKDLQPLK